MCYFITIAVPGRAVEEVTVSVPRGLTVLPYSNPSVTNCISKDFHTLVLTSGMCSCDLFSQGQPTQPTGHHTERLRKKYEKQNWSKSKIQRALEGSLKSRKQQSTQTGYDDRVGQLVADIAEVHGEVRIIAHFYSGGVETEEFKITRGMVLSPSAFRSGDFVACEDELVTISRAKSQKTREEQRC